MYFNLEMKMYVLILLWTLCVTSSNTEKSNDELFYEYRYMAEGESLYEEEMAFWKSKKQLTEDEEIVRNYLQHLKRLEYERTKDNFLPAQPLNLALDNIKASEIYRILKMLPKGGILHSHHEQLVSKATLLDIVKNSDAYENLYIKQEDPFWRLDFFINPPKGWEKVKDNEVKFSKENILKHITHIGIINNSNTTCRQTDPGELWKIFGRIRTLAADSLINHINITGLYMKAMMQEALNENVMYIESRSRSYDKIYTLDCSPKYAKSNGKRILDTETGELELKIVRDTVRDFTQAYKTFTGYKRIVHSIKVFNREKMSTDLKTAYFLYKTFPNFVIGFDALGKEDSSHSLFYYLQNFAIMMSKKKFIPYFFHAGETLWPADIVTSMFEDEFVGAGDNVLDAFLLGSRRIGHGINLINRPSLMKKMKERDIAVEVSPASNLLLGYVDDQRTHPAITYYRYGIPITLSSDAPGLFGQNEFTIDWYYAFMAWRFDLFDLKVIARNSLEYSVMSKYERINALQQWTEAWYDFIDKIKMEACHYQNNYNGATTPKINDILPHGGPEYGGNYIYVFGRNFNVGICYGILCQIGDALVPGQYLYDHMLKCRVPERKKDTVNMFISFDGGQKFIPTNQTYTYFTNY